MWNDTDRERISAAFREHQVLQALDKLSETEPDLASEILDQHESAPGRLEENNKNLHETLRRKLDNAKRFHESAKRLSSSPSRGSSSSNSGAAASTTHKSATK